MQSSLNRFLQKFRTAGTLISRRLSRVIFGNGVSMGNNIRGKARLIHSRLHGDGNGADSASVAGFRLRTRGCLRLGNPYTPGLDELISEIRDQFKTLIREDGNVQILPEDPDEICCSRNLLDPEQKLPDAQKLLTDSIRSMIRGYYGGPIRVKRIRMYRNYHIPPGMRENRHIFAERWHFDFRSTEYLKLFVNLSDVDESSGPLKVQPRQETMKILRSGYRDCFNYNGTEEMLESETTLVKGIGELGTALLCNTQECLHRAGIPDPGEERDIVQFTFAPK